MPQAPLQEKLAQAIRLHQAGRLADASTLYQEILGHDPRHADALRLLGVIAHTFKRHDAAEQLLRQAIAVNAGVAEYHNDLALALQAQGRHLEACEACQAALRLNPTLPEAHYNLGTIHKALGQMEEAAAAYRQALGLRPDYADAHNNLGNLLMPAGRAREAINHFHAAVRLRPHNADTRMNLAHALQIEQQYPAAVEQYRAALELTPSDAVLRRYYGDALQSAGRLQDAEREYRAALALDPALAAAHNNLGTTLKAMQRIDEAVEAFRAALAIRRDYAEALSNLASAMKDQGKLDEAVECFERAAAADPQSVDIASNLIYMIHFHPAWGPPEIAAALAEWNRRFAAPLLGSRQTFRNTPDPNRALRIGWISPDFRRHPIGRFLLPLFRAHDPTTCQFYCYSDVTAEDDVTRALKTHAQQWRQTDALSHEQLAAAIREDRIDILLDLTMHMQKTRLLAMARKPAPIQMTYLAYASSTGMPAIDYRLTDAAIEDGGTGEPFVEKPLQLQSYWCFEPDAAAQVMPVSPPPCQKNGWITFGSLNNFCKASRPALDAWAAILAAVPEARLLLHASAGAHRERTLSYFAGRGVAAERCRFVGMLPFDGYMRLYDDMDIALDPFPYGGGTTTCDALWMGVPVVSLAGRTGVGRGGASLLRTIGLEELLTTSAPDYVARAVAIAEDSSRLAALRGTLRERMKSSPLMDAPRFAADMQHLLRAAWRDWCARPAESARSEQL